MECHFSRFLTKAEGDFVFLVIRGKYLKKVHSHVSIQSPNLLRFRDEKKDEKLSLMLMKSIKYGFVDIVREFQRCSTEKHILEAIRRNNMEILRILVDEHLCEFTVISIKYACRKDRLDMVRFFLEEKKRIMIPRYISCSVEAGCDNIVRYLIENKCPMKYSCIVSVIHENRIDLLKELRKAGCPWKKEKSLELLRYNQTEMRSLILSGELD